MCGHNSNTNIPPDNTGLSAVKQAEKERGAPYVHYYDKVYKNKTRNRSKLEQKYHYNCRRGYVTGECEQGHRYAKVILCGKEWCQECGKDGSAIHERRIARWYDKIHSLNEVGYLVITVPPECKQEFRDQINLSAYRRAIVRYLKRSGYDKGLSRWHWLGDCRTCKGDGCDKCRYTGAGRTFHPHLNIVIEHGYMKPAELRGLKGFCTKWCKNNLLGGADPDNSVVCHYQFTDKPEKKTHILRYVTRSTLRHADFFKLRKQLHGYRTSHSWGKFDPPDQPNTSELVALEKGVCPCCGGRVEWQDFISTAYWRSQPYEVMEGGYYKLKDRPDPPPDPGYKLINYNSNKLNYTNQRKASNEWDVFYKN